MMQRDGHRSPSAGFLNERLTHMTALMDPIPVTRSSPSVIRSAIPASRQNVRIRVSDSPSKRTTSNRTRLAACLDRCAAAGIRLVITAPFNTRTFARGVSRFADRRVDLVSHGHWEAAYRAFCGRISQPWDRGSWRILAVDRDDRVVGAITARFFCGEVQQHYLHLPSLLVTTGPIFREHCELAIAEVIAAARQSGRTMAEISHWAVAPVWHAALISVTLARAMGALAAAFDAPMAIMAANNRGAEVTRLMRLGSAPLGLAGRACLPPFVHDASGAWLRLLVLDVTTFNARSGGSPAGDLALLRERAAIISVD